MKSGESEIFFVTSILLFFLHIYLKCVDACEELEGENMSQSIKSV